MTFGGIALPLVIVWQLDGLRVHVTRCCFKTLQLRNMPNQRIFRGASMMSLWGSHYWSGFRLLNGPSLIGLPLRPLSMFFHLWVRKDLRLLKKGEFLMF